MIYREYTECYSISFLFLFFFHQSSLYPIKIFAKCLVCILFSAPTLSELKLIIFLFFVSELSVYTNGHGVIIIGIIGSRFTPPLPACMHCIYDCREGHGVIYREYTECYSISFLFLFFFHQSSLYPIKIFAKCLVCILFSAPTLSELKLIIFLFFVSELSVYTNGHGVIIIGIIGSRFTPPLPACMHCIYDCREGHGVIYREYTECYSISFLFLFFFHQSSLYPIKIFAKCFYLLVII